MSYCTCCEICHGGTCDDPYVSVEDAKWNGAHDRSDSELRKYRDEIAQARGAKSTIELIDAVLDGDESLRTAANRACDQIDADSEV